MNDFNKVYRAKTPRAQRKISSSNLAWPATRLRTCFASSREFSFFRFCNSNFKYLSLGLLHQSSLLGDLFHGPMFFTYFSDKLIRRHVILDHAQSSELRGNGRVLHRLFHSGNQRFRYLYRYSGWCEEGQPDTKEVLPVTEFSQGGDLGIFRNLARGEYSLHASALHVGDQGAQGQHPSLHMPPQDGSHARGSSFERHHGQPGAGERVDHLQGEMTHRSSSDGA